MVNLNRSIYAAYRAPGWRELQAGDVVYLRDGVHDTVYHPGHDGGPDEGGNFLIFAQALETGTESAPIRIESYPGERAILDPSYGALPIALLGSQHVQIANLEIRRGWSRGLLISGSEHISVRGLVVRDTDGPVSDNVAGLEVHSSRDIEVSHSAFIDNYDHAAAMEDRQTHNSCNAVAFGNRGTFRLHHNAFIQTREAPFSGCGFKYKHASRDPAATFELDHNYFENHMYAAVGVGTANAHVHHNVISGAPVAFSSVDWGGTTHQQNQVFEYNTVYNARAFGATPTLDWNDHEGGPWEGFSDVIFRENVVHDGTPSPTAESRTVLINPYISDALHDVAAEGASFSHNCYWSEGSVSFGNAEADGSWGARGGGYDIDGWRTTYGWDLDSLIQNPMLTDPENHDFQVDATRCQDRGAHADGHTPPMSLEDVVRCH